MIHSIPNTAHEVIQERWETGAKKVAYYELDDQRVGYRSWTASGQMDMEYSMHNGKMHGMFRTWHENGQLCEQAYYVQGKEHGTTQQYDAAGQLLGSYTLEHGTGIDLWFAAPGILSEERHLQDGERHGYERWWNGDNQTISQEGHFWQGREHGIFRHWNAVGRLRRGYPRYFVAGQRVTKQQYERACRTDPTLPAVAVNDTTPYRKLPQTLSKHQENK